MRPDIRADGEKSDVAEVEQPGEADDDVQAERQPGVNGDLDREFEVAAVIDADQGHDDDDQQQDERGFEAARQR